MTQEYLSEKSRELIAQAAKLKDYEKFIGSLSPEQLHIEFFKLYQKLPESAPLPKRLIEGELMDPETLEKIDHMMNERRRLSKERASSLKYLLLSAELTILLDHPFFRGTQSFGQYIRMEFRKLIFTGINRNPEEGNFESRQPLYRLLDLDEFGSGLFDQQSCQRLEREALKNFTFEQLQIKNLVAEYAVLFNTPELQETDPAVALLHRWRQEYIRKYSDEP